MDVREGSQATVRDGRSGDSGPSCRVVRVMALGEGSEELGRYLVLMKGTYRPRWNCFHLAGEALL